MGFSGGGSNVLKPHKHSSAVQDGSPLDMNNVTEATLTAGDIVYSDGAALQRLAIGADTTVLAVSGSTPSWSASTSNPLIKVTKTFEDIAAAEMEIYTLPQDAALVNVYTDITTVFDISVAVTIGDAGDDNGFAEATDWTTGTGLTDATRGAYVTSFKTMRSTSGTTAIKAYNFNTAGAGSSLGPAADGVNIGDPESVAAADPNGVATPTGLGLKSLYFDGNDAINIDGAEPFSTTVGTITAWYYNTGTMTHKQIVAFGDTNAGSYLFIQATSADDKLIGVRNQSGDKWEIRNVAGEPAADLSIGWHHMAISQDGAAVVCYVDGVELTVWDNDTDRSLWMTAELDNGRIGCDNRNSAGNSAFITGNIMEVGLWNVALSEAQIQDLYDSGNGKPCNTYTTGLRAYYSGSHIPAINEAPSTSDTQGEVDFYLQVVD